MKKNYLRDIHDSDIVDSKKIDCQDYFELVYLRHRYFRKSINPTPERLAEFEEMICNISDKYFVKNQKIFNQLGFESDDLRNIARVHTVSFVSMSGLKENPDKMKKFTERHKSKYGNNSEPGHMDVFRKECYDLARFLNQRMQDIVRNAKSKNKNIRGTENQTMFFMGDPKRNPSDLDLVKYASFYGYKKISKKKYKEFLKENNPKIKNKFLNKQNKIIRAVHIKAGNLSVEDIQDIGLDPRDNMYYSDPEDNLIKLENNAILYKYE